MSTNEKDQILILENKIDEMLNEYDQKKISQFDFKKLLLKSFISFCYYDEFIEKDKLEENKSEIEKLLESWEWEIFPDDLDDAERLFVININLLELKFFVIKSNYEMHIRNLKEKHGEIDFILHMDRDAFWKEISTKIEKTRKDFYLNNLEIINSLKEKQVLINSSDDSIILSANGRSINDIYEKIYGYIFYNDKFYTKKEIFDKKSEILELLKRDKNLQFNFDW